LEPSLQLATAEKRLKTDVVLHQFLPDGLGTLEVRR